MTNESKQKLSGNECGGANDPLMKMNLALKVRISNFVKFKFKRLRGWLTALKIYLYNFSSKTLKRLKGFTLRRKF